MKLATNFILLQGSRRPRFDGRIIDFVFMMLVLVRAIEYLGTTDGRQHIVVAGVGVNGALQS